MAERNVGMMNCYETNVMREHYKIVTLNSKVDYLEVLDIPHRHKAHYSRDDIRENKLIFENALYHLAKQKPKDFRGLYSELRKRDSQFFKMAKKVLKKIQAEYKFN